MAQIKMFLPNTEDNLHCLQSCFSMVHNTVFSDEIDAKGAEQLTNFREGFPTWPFKAMLSFAKRGLHIVNIENFPLDMFLQDPVKAIRKQFLDEKVADHIIEVSNLPDEIELIKCALSTGRVEFKQQIPTLADIKFYLKKNWFVICNVNSRALANIVGEYAGHFVIVEEINDEFMIVQNPGLPPVPNQKVLISDFLNAWNYPDENAANIIAVSSLE